MTNVINKVAYEKIKNRSDNITYHDCELAADYDGKIISYIPEELITEELCITILTKNKPHKELIQAIPSKLLTTKLALSVVEVNGNYLKYLPCDIINKNVILKAVNQTMAAMKYIPEKHQTDDVYKALLGISPKILNYINTPSLSLCEYVVENIPTAISYIKDRSFFTDKMFERVAMADWRNLQYVPYGKITASLCSCAFNADWRSFKFFPEKFKTKEWCEIVTNKDASYIKHCPTTLISVEICIKCIKKQGKLIEFVPDCFKTEELCLLAAKKDYRLLKFLPPASFSYEFFTECLKINERAICFIPYTVITFEFYKALLNLTTFSKIFKDALKAGEKELSLYVDDYRKYVELKRLAEKYTDKIDYVALKMERELCIRKTIASFYDDETDIFTVEEICYGELYEHRFAEFKQFYLYLNGNLKGANLTEYNVSKIERSAYNLDGAYLSSGFLIEQHKYNGDFYNLSIGRYNEDVTLLPVLVNETTEASLISHADLHSQKLNSSIRKIFYITDIHLNQKLKKRFPKNASFEEVKFFVQKQIRKMINPEKERSTEDYLLIGGDVSFCFEISKIFYSELCKFWDPSKIIVVLGNHELWNFAQFGYVKTDSSAEEIFEEYKALFAELGILFLQNSLLIVKQDSSIILSEKDIIDKSIDEMQYLALDSNLIVFGGIGFSAYNTDFNATHGIYRDTITSIQDDLRYTQQSERVYNKLCEVFPKDVVVVLSHMPLKDWSTNKAVKKWIYVNGHTHYNYYKQSDECTIYADNQVGYKSERIGLKYFKTSFQYDIFKYYSDGIHNITKTQYMDFNRGNGTPSVFKKDVEYIVMLKRQDIYLFLYEDKKGKKLYLLNGGVINRLNVTDVEYYYENMLKYSEFVKIGMREYNEVLKNIADAVKKIGGQGKIHGCIVDIDIFNHIYLNPQDGSITAYYSPRFGERYEYTNIEELLNAQIPNLYANYQKLIRESKEVIGVSNNEIQTNEVLHILDTAQYKPSKIIKQLQYITENNVIRIWSDDFVVNYNQYLEGKKLLS